VKYRGSVLPLCKKLASRHVRAPVPPDMLEPPFVTPPWPQSKFTGPRLQGVKQHGNPPHPALCFYIQRAGRPATPQTPSQAKPQQPDPRSAPLYVRAKLQITELALKPSHTCIGGNVRPWDGTEIIAARPNSMFCATENVKFSNYRGAHRRQRSVPFREPNSRTRGAPDKPRWGRHRHRL
jgi:hypothetical protein